MRRRREIRTLNNASKNLDGSGSNQIEADCITAEIIIFLENWNFPNHSTATFIFIDLI